MIKKRLAVFVLAAGLLGSEAAYAAPSCIMMRFTDDTKYAGIGTAGKLSDLLLEKLLESGRFNFKETQVIPEEWEKKLYDEKTVMYELGTAAFRSGDYNALFEGPGFDAYYASDIASAEVGQYVSPDTTRRIGGEHGADYLISGTILNLGSGEWESQLSYGASNRSQLAVQVNVKLIRAETGEIVWKKETTARETKSSVNVLGLNFGSKGLSEEMYYKMLDKAAEQLAKAMIEDAYVDFLM